MNFAKRTERLSWLSPMMSSSSSKDKVTAANNIIKKSIFNLAHFKNVHVDMNEGWKTENQSRSLRRWLHTHVFLDDFIEAYRITGDEQYFHESFNILNDWFDKFPIFKMDTIDSLAYHDEGSAQRLLYWLKYYSAFHYLFNDYQKVFLEDKIDEIAELLTKDSFYAGLNNHGMFQDMSIVAYTIFKFEDFEATNKFNFALERIIYYFDHVFTVEGVHKEHAPSYHILLLSSLKKILLTLNKSGFKNQKVELLKSVMAKGEHYLVNVVTPDFRLPNISDSTEFTLSGQYKDLFNSEKYKFISSLGKNGEEPDRLINSFPESGYLIARDSWKPEALYFLFIAAYHVRYHKHSDDLSFLIYKKLPIFVDAGPFSYNYQDPMTIYAYSQYAHSTLIVNEKSLPRTDGKYHKVFIKDNKINVDEKKFVVQGVNERYEHVTHTRRITGNIRNETFAIIDSIYSKLDNKYELLFQINGVLTVNLESNQANIYNQEVKIAQLEITNHDGIKNLDINLIRGQTDPMIMGYQFPKKEVAEPMNTLVLSFRNINDIATIETKISLF